VEEERDGTAVTQVPDRLVSLVLAAVMQAHVIGSLFFGALVMYFGEWSLDFRDASWILSLSLAHAMTFPFQC
jgi:hypothetical protein